MLSKDFINIHKTTVHKTDSYLLLN